MPRIHLRKGSTGYALCDTDAMRIDIVEPEEFKRMIRERYSTLCPECRGRVELPPFSQESTS